MSKHVDIDHVMYVYDCLLQDIFTELKRQYPTGINRRIVDRMDDVTARHMSFNSLPDGLVDALTQEAAKSLEPNEDMEYEKYKDRLDEARLELNDLKNYRDERGDQ